MHLARPPDKFLELSQLSQELRAARPAANILDIFCREGRTLCTEVILLQQITFVVIDTHSRGHVEPCSKCSHSIRRCCPLEEAAALLALVKLQRAEWHLHLASKLPLLA